MVSAGRGGRIINISSVEGKQANKAAVSPYIVFKHALNGFTKAVAFEYGPMGITSNAILPGAIETDLMKELGPEAAKTMGVTYEEFLDSYAQESMIKRLNTVDEVAAIALVLASPPGAGITSALDQRRRRHRGLVAGAVAMSRPTGDQPHITSCSRLMRCASTAVPAARVAGRRRCYRLLHGDGERLALQPVALDHVVEVQTWARAAGRAVTIGERLQLTDLLGHPGDLVGARTAALRSTRSIM